MNVPFNRRAVLNRGTVLNRRTMLNRRTLLRGAAAGSALGLFPWLGSANAADSPKRLILFFTPHGTIFDRWRPSGGETDFTFSPILSPLEKHRDRLAIIDGVHMVSGTEYYIPHTYIMPLLWTGSPINTSATLFEREDHNQSFGWNTGVSIDQTIANMLPQTTPYKTLEFGHRSGRLHPAWRMIYTAPDAPKSPLDTPDKAFSALFEQLGDAAGEAEAHKTRRKHILDAVLADFNTRRNKLSGSDRTRLDAHATSLEEVQRTLALQTACEAPPEPTQVNDETAIDLQSDLIAASFGCGLTNIASMQVRGADNDNSLYPWLGMDSMGHHTWSHNSSAESQAIMAKVYTWYSERLSYLLDKLASTPDANGESVLDNTVVIWGSELGHGWTHSLDNIPFVVAGGANTPVRGGRYLKVQNARANRILVSAFHAMGIDSVQKYGTLDNGSGGLSGLLSI